MYLLPSYLLNCPLGQGKIHHLCTIKLWKCSSLATEILPLSSVLTGTYSQLLALSCRQPNDRHLSLYSTNSFSLIKFSQEFWLSSWQGSRHIWVVTKLDGNFPPPSLPWVVLLRSSHLIKVRKRIQVNPFSSFERPKANTQQVLLSSKKPFLHFLDPSLAFSYLQVTG